MISLLTACGGGPPSYDTTDGQQFLEQLKQSAEEMKSYQKTIKDLDATTLASQDSLYPLDTMNKATFSEQFQEDLSYVFEYYYKDKALAEYMDTVVVGDTLIATVKDGQEGKSKLRTQKILKNSKGLYSYVFSESMNTNWLYDLSITSEVWFDSLHLYRQHKLKMYNKIHLLNSSIHSEIVGKASY
ncbi:MAG: hypothetical protein AAFY71_01705 [Bacteroidota bacterium]